MTTVPMSAVISSMGRNFEAQPDRRDRASTRPQMIDVDPVGVFRQAQAACSSCRPAMARPSLVTAEHQKKAAMT